MSVEFRAVREEEKEACIALWCTVWQGANSETYFRRYFFGDVEWLPYYTQVAVEDGEIVSAVQICKRTVPCGEYRLVMGGIANVATLPEHRGKGYNTECMKRAIAVMEADAMDFSLLFTGINAYYARLGYCDMPRPNLAGTLRESLAPLALPYRVRLATATDLPAVFSLYDAYNAQRPMTVLRNEAYWRDWIGIAPSKSTGGILVAEDTDGNLVGYLRPGTFNSAIPYNANEVELRLIEYGARTDVAEADQKAIAQALIHHAAQEFQAQSATRLIAALPSEPSVKGALAGVLTVVESNPSGFAMGRILHATNLFQSLTFEWNDRWNSAGRPQGDLVFETPYGLTRLRAEGNALSVERGESGGRTLSQSEFLMLLFGEITPAAVAATTEEKALLSALFPPRNPIYWGADGF